MNTNRTVSNFFNLKTKDGIKRAMASAKTVERWEVLLTKIYKENDYVFPQKMFYEAVYHEESEVESTFRKFCKALQLNPYSFCEELEEKYAFLNPRPVQKPCIQYDIPSDKQEFIDFFKSNATALKWSDMVNSVKAKFNGEYPGFWYDEIIGPNGLFVVTISADGGVVEFKIRFLRVVGGTECK